MVVYFYLLDLQKAQFFVWSTLPLDVKNLFTDAGQILPCQARHFGMRRCAPAKIVYVVPLYAYQVCMLVLQTQHLTPQTTVLQYTFS